MQAAQLQQQLQQQQQQEQHRRQLQEQAVAHQARMLAIQQSYEDRFLKFTQDVAALQAHVNLSSPPQSADEGPLISVTRRRTQVLTPVGDQVVSSPRRKKSSPNKRPRNSPVSSPIHLASQNRFAGFADTVMSEQDDASVSLDLLDLPDDIATTLDDETDSSPSTSIDETTAQVEGMTIDPHEFAPTEGATTAQVEGMTIDPSEFAPTEVAEPHSASTLDPTSGSNGVGMLF
jgi:hypothetical protein